MATNKPLGEDVVKNPALMHRLAWMRRSRSENTTPAHPATDAALREQHA